MATHGGEIVADELMVALLTGEDVTIPVIDLDSTEFQIPGDTNSDAYSILSKLTNADLTTGSITGTGTFDKLMVGVAAQLKGEFDNNRITGAEYTKAYIGITQSALSIAAQFLLGKDSAYWQAVQAQALAVTARLQLQTAKIQNAAAKLEAMTTKANYALTKLKLSILDTEYATGQYNLDNLLPSQLAQTNAQTSLLSYDLTAVKPVEVANLNKQGTLLDSQKLGQDKQNDTAAYNLSTILVKQAGLLDEQIAGAAKDTDTKTYNLTDIMPVQKLSLQEQAEAQRGQTMNTRSDGTTPIAGSIGKQNELYAQQVVSYQKDSQLKAAKVFSDVWITCRSIEEGFPLPKQFDYLSTDYATEKVFQAIIDDNDLG
jgi:hypothetical protein